MSQAQQTVRMAPLDNMGMRSKLLLIAAIAAIPGVVLLYLLVLEKNRQLDFYERELSGASLIGPTRELYDAIIRVAIEGTSTEAPASERRAQIAQLRPRLNAAFGRLEAAANDPRGIDIGEQVFAVRSESMRLVSAMESAEAPGALGAHTGAMTALRGLAAQIGNRSNLVLDPDLSTYFMVDIVVNRVPDAMDALVESLFILRSSGRAGTMTEEGRTRLIVLAGRLRAFTDRTDDALLSLGGRVSAAQQIALREKLDALERRVEPYGRALQSLGVGDFEDADGRLEVDARLAVESLGALWDESGRVLGSLLNSRIADHYYEKGLLMALVSTLFMLSLVLVLYVSGSVSRRVGRLSMIANRIASQSNVGPEDQESIRAVVSQDEVGTLAAAVLRMSKSINQHIGALERARNQLEDYTAHLQQKIDERTAEIAEKNAELQAAMDRLKDAQNQLVVSEKMASLGNLTAGIAHEIKNPLNFVNNFADLSRDLLSEVREILAAHSDKMDAATRDDLADLMATLEGNLKKIHEHGNRADSIVKGMLAHSRGKTGERVPIDLNAMVREYVNLAFHGMRAKDSNFNITIVADYDPGVGEVMGVPQDLSRVFLNIVNNACYSAHRKRLELGDHFEPRLSVSTRRSGDRVEVRIRDNGRGIPKDRLGRIFEPFYTTKPTGEGTGLGLSISWDIIVDQHRGRIDVQSDEGEFAEFTITLPGGKA